MSTVEEIEKAVAKLSPDEFAAFRARLAELEAERFDQRIEQDALSGKLDRLADEALAERRRNTDISALFDLIDEGAPTDVARDKDAMIGEAVADEHRRETSREPGRR